MGALDEAGSGERTTRRIELLPNCALTPATARLFFAIVASTSLSIALAFVVRGYWPVLPFAGLELALLGWALRETLKRRHWTQVIEISDERVLIETAGPAGRERHVYPRHWASVRLRKSISWHPSRLLVGSHGKACEIGAFLTEEERVALYRRLEPLIGAASRSPPLAN